MAQIKRNLFKAISKMPFVILEFLFPHLPIIRPSEPESGSIGIDGAFPSILPATLSPTQVETLLRTDEAIFDHMFRYVKSP